MEQYDIHERNLGTPTTEDVDAAFWRGATYGVLVSVVAAIFAAFIYGIVTVIVSE